jgi:hypothetical protein
VAAHLHFTWFIYVLDSIILFLLSSGFTLVWCSLLGIPLFCISSLDVLRQILWKHNPRLMMNPFSLRARLSMKTMKMKIGSCNFIERMTPLLYYRFALIQPELSFYSVVEYIKYSVV